MIGRKLVINVILGERAWEVTKPTMKRSREWRQRFRLSVEPMIDQAQTFAAQLSGDVVLIDDDNQLNTDLINMGLSTALMTADVLDQVIDLVFLFSPILEANRDEIEEIATDDEALAAFWQMLRVIYPFEMAASMMNI